MESFNKNQWVRSCIRSGLSVALLLSMFGPVWAQPDQSADSLDCVPGTYPANPNASATTKQVIGWLGSLRNCTTNRLISGQFCGYPNPRPDLLVDSHPWSTFTTAYMDDVFRMTGKYPALMGVDYYGNTTTIDNPPGIQTREHSDERILNYKAVNKALIDWWKAGGLVTINIHSYRPDTHQPDHSGHFMKFGFGGSTKYPTDERYKEYDLKRMLPGGADRGNWLAMMDQLAVGLTELKRAGVVVLWRPFHEVNAGFWWGKHDGETFKKVWQGMFSYFSTTKKLDNLVWVFTGSPTYYPGNQFVDLNGQDTYNQTVGQDRMYAFSAKNCKPYALTEYGFGIDKDRDNSTASYDFGKLLPSIKASIPQSTYFLIWSDAWRIANPNHLNQKHLLNDPTVITRDEVDFRSYKASTQPAKKGP